MNNTGRLTYLGKAEGRKWGRHGVCSGGVRGGEWGRHKEESREGARGGSGGGEGRSGGGMRREVEEARGVV